MSIFKKIFPLLLVILSAFAAFMADLWWKDVYNFVVADIEKAFHLLYAVMIAISLFYALKIFEINKLWSNFQYASNKRELSLRHIQDSEKFSEKIKNHLISNQSNRYLIKCFDSLYSLIVSGDEFVHIQKHDLLLKCSLIDAMNRIHNGAKLGKDLYLFFLEKTVELEPKHVIGVWDIQINPIQPLTEISGEEIFQQYEKMYKHLLNISQENLIRIFIYDPIETTLDEAFELTLEVTKYFEQYWGINKFYYVPKVTANVAKIFDGLIIDKKFYLEFDGKDEVSFRKWDSNNSDSKNLSLLLEQCTLDKHKLINSKEVVYAYPTI